MGGFLAFADVSRGKIAFPRKICQDSGYRNGVCGVGFDRHARLPLSGFYVQDDLGRQRCGAINGGAMNFEPQLLITDDDRDFRETLGEALERKGFVVTLAADGDQAVKLVRAQTFHLMVLDMHMPKLSGLDTILLVRQWFDKLPCILMSAKLDEQIVTTARSIPTVEVMAKPFPLKLFTETIRDTLRRAYS